MGLVVLIGIIGLKQDEKPQSIEIYVTVDWEGRSLDDEDIEAMLIPDFQYWVWLYEEYHKNCSSLIPSYKLQ